jgi:hypothetical protein
MKATYGGENLDISEAKKVGVTEHGMMMSFVICNDNIKYKVSGRNNRILFSALPF